MKNALRIFLVVGTSFVLAGCGAAGLGLDSRTSVTLDGGEVRLLYALCPGESMHVVEVAERTGGSFGSPIYWRIESVSGSPQREFVVGKTPGGFTETVPLTRDLPTDELLSIEATRRWMGMSFKIENLSSGEVIRGNGDRVDPATFWNEAATECRVNQVSAALMWLALPTLWTMVALATRLVWRTSWDVGRRVTVLSSLLGGAGALVGALFGRYP